MYKESLQKLHREPFNHQTFVSFFQIRGMVILIVPRSYWLYEASSIFTRSLHDIGFLNLVILGIYLKNTYIWIWFKVTYS